MVMSVSALLDGLILNVGPILMTAYQVLVKIMVLAM